MGQQISSSRDRDDALALPMFVLSIVFLALLAGVVITMVDIPRVDELAGTAAGTATGTSATENAEPSTTSSTVPAVIQLSDTANLSGKGLAIVLALIWPLFWLEYFFVARHLKDEEGARIVHWQRLFACILPPLRLGAVSGYWDHRIWLPSLGWRKPGRKLSRSLERVLGKPMLVIALLILPILLIEFAFKDLVQEHFWLRIVLHVTTGFIWFAFTLEFLVMIGASNRKLQYIKKNWIDLVIILIPLVSFLRSLRVLRLARLAKAQKIARLLRIYRMRSLGTKAMKALLMFGFINRVLKISPEKRLRKLKSELNLRELEINELKSRISDTESMLVRPDSQSV